VSVKRESDGLFSSYIHASLGVGDTVEAAAPRGDFTLASGKEPVVLLSAGIGITPMVAMLASIATTTPSRLVWWIHVARTMADYALASEAEALIQQIPNARYQLYLTRAADTPNHSTSVNLGRLTERRLQELGLPKDATAYVCGPTGFIESMTDALTRVGLQTEKIHSEVFGGLPRLNPGVVPAPAKMPHPPEGPAGSGPAVTFARSGVTAQWSDRYNSLLELAEACDVPTRWSCRTGVCHNCVTGMLAGQVSYSPEPLEMPDAGDILLCCSKPQEEVVLDA
jgi:ferredoxin-NADP reductase